MHRMALNWPWSVKGELHTLGTPPRPKFGELCSTTYRFQGTKHFIIPIDYHAKRKTEQKKMPKKKKKFQIAQFF